MAVAAQNPALLFWNAMLTAFDGRTQVQGKLMKDSKTRILTLHCLQGCTQAYLVWLPGSTAMPDLVDGMLTCGTDFFMASVMGRMGLVHEYLRVVCVCLKKRLN